MWHHRGLRQGDPLSPQLSVMVINMLNTLLARALELGILRKLVRQELVTSVSLYADDVIIFYHPDEVELHAVHETLVLFGHAS